MVEVNGHSVHVNVMAWRRGLAASASRGSAPATPTAAAAAAGGGLAFTAFDSLTAGPRFKKKKVHDQRVIQSPIVESDT